MKQAIILIACALLLLAGGCSEKTNGRATPVRLGVLERDYLANRSASENAKLHRPERSFGMEAFVTDAEPEFSEKVDAGEAWTGGSHREGRLIWSTHFVGVTNPENTHPLSGDEMEKQYYAIVMRSRKAMNLGEPLWKNISGSWFYGTSLDEISGGS